MKVTLTALIRSVQHIEKFCIIFDDNDDATAAEKIRVFVCANGVEHLQDKTFSLTMTHKSILGQKGK